MSYKMMIAETSKSLAAVVHVLLNFWCQSEVWKKKVTYYELQSSPFNGWKIHQIYGGSTIESKLLKKLAVDEGSGNLNAAYRSS